MASRHAFVIAAFFVAVTVVETDAAVAASAWALVIGATLARAVLADAKDAKLAGTAIDVVATLAALRVVSLPTAELAVGARRIGKAGAIDAGAAAGAFIVGTALTRQPAVVGVVAAVLASRAAGDAGAIHTGSAVERAVGVAAAFRLLADAIRVAHLAAGALVVAAALRAIVFWGAVIATSLVAIGDRRANTSIADGSAAKIPKRWIAIRGRAAF